ncbi:MAG: hypothetical protein V1838_05520 [Patescibacteria group bacterium]
MNKSIKYLLIAIILVLVVGAGSWGLYAALRGVKGEQSNYETYKNTLYGYTFSHPADLNVYEPNDGEVYLAKSQYENDDEIGISINVSQNDVSNPGGSFDKIRQWYDSSDHGYDSANVTSVHWLNQDGLRVTARNSSVYGPIDIIEQYAFSPDNRYIYNIRYDSPQQSTTSLADVYENVINSFQFGEGIIPDVSQWLTYSDDLHGFSFMYPEKYLDNIVSLKESAGENGSVKQIAVSYDKTATAPFTLLKADVYRNDDGLTPEDIFRSKLSFPGLEASYGTDRQIKNRTAFSVKLIGNPKTIVEVVPNGNYVIVFFQTNGDDDSWEFYDQVLSAVSFF